MARPPARICLTPEEETTLRQWTRQGTSEQRLVERAGVILLSNEGLTVEKIAERLDTRPARVSKWRQRFFQNRLEGLADAPRPGKPNKYEDTEERVLKALDESPPKGFSQWNGKLLAKGSATSARRRYGAFCAPWHSAAATPKLVHHHRPGIWAEGGRCGWSMSESS